MARFKRYETIIDERVKSDDPQIQKAADDLLDQCIRKAEQKLAEEVLQRAVSVDDSALHEVTQLASQIVNLIYARHKKEWDCR